MNKILIGISGKMGSGKSTLAKGIIDVLGGTKVSLASPIYNLQDMIYDECGLELEGDKDRDLLIALGLWARNKDPNFWIKQLQRDLDVLSREFDVIVCDDVRFPNEARFFEENGILIRINGQQRGANVDHNINNVSEIALDDYKFYFGVSNKTGKQEMIHSALDIIRSHYET